MVAKSKLSTENIRSRTTDELALIAASLTRYIDANRRTAFTDETKEMLAICYATRRAVRHELKHRAKAAQLSFNW